MDDPKRKLRRFYSYPVPSINQQGNSSEASDGTDLVSQVVPVSVPLNNVRIGAINYAPSDWDDVEVIYELESSDIVIKTKIEGENGEPPGIYRISGVSAADLSLNCVIPGSLESMVSRLVLELENDIIFEPTFKSSSSQDKPPSSIDKDDNSLKSRIVRLSASVHEVGHLRDILLFLKCENIADLNPELAAQVSKKNEEESGLAKLTFLDFLPIWVLYIPWWLYSKNARTTLQKMVIIYYFFSVIWAFWQLYRHVYLIHVVLEPFVVALKLYLASVVEYFDWFLSSFTHLWHKYLSPLNVLFGFILAPLVRAIMPLRNVAIIFINFMKQFLVNSSLLTALKALLAIFYRLAALGFDIVWASFAFLLRPLSGVWKTILNARITVEAFNLQQRWVFTLLAGSFKSIGNGLAKFVGYTQKTKKRRRAVNQQPQDIPQTSTPEYKLRQRRMPMYYNSPLPKDELK